MKVVLMLLMVTGCAVKGDFDEVNNKVTLANEKLDKIYTTEEENKETLGEIKTTEVLPKFDISQKSDEELTEIAVTAKKIAEGPIEEKDKQEPFTIVDPPTNIPPKKQALIYRIKAYLAQIFKRSKK